MFTHSYKNRFDMNFTQTNILMTQIRAEKKLFSSKNQQVLSSRREVGGKRIFQEILLRPSLSPTAKENKADNNIMKVDRGKRMLIETARVPQERSRSGRKRFEDTMKREQQQRASVQKQVKAGRKRLDCSPSHQHLRTSINLRWD